MNKIKHAAPSLTPIAEPQKISSYFRAEWRNLAIVTVTGLIYNVGLIAGPWFEGQMAQCLENIFRRRAGFSDMARLVALYVSVIAAVQFARSLKRLCVRRFANATGRRMKEILYANLIHRSSAELQTADVGSVMTKAVSDVDACAEGMRKFTTEIFDTGVALAAYCVMLFIYDWRLALLCLLFPPVSYVIAANMKSLVQRTGAAARESAGRLNAATLDRAGNAVTYRISGCEAGRDKDYERHLKDYEKTSVRAEIQVSAMPPLYQVVSMASGIFILYFGSENVLHTGWTAWNLAAFTTFLSCYTKLAVKSSHAAKLFNAVQKAQVSWKRIKELMQPVQAETAPVVQDPAELVVTGLTDPRFGSVSFTAGPGQIIGVTGPVASGKSSFGRAFLCEEPYQGSITFAGTELRDMSPQVLSGIIGYLGHDTELMSDTIRSNVLMGDESVAADAPDIRSSFLTDDGTGLQQMLAAVCLDREVAEMPTVTETRIGTGGVLLSGGQKQRLALARTLAHRRPVLILDDPFSALDRETEQAVFRNLREIARDSVVILISHRLYLFPETDQVIWMEDGLTVVQPHERMLKEIPHYRELFALQEEGKADEQRQ